jgi:formylmethanofuran dehydrogenase subunit E
MNESTIAAEVERLHGYMCRGVAIGVQAANIALSELGRNSDSNEVLANVRRACALSTAFSI